jgi:predicted thioesterase
MQVSPKTGTTRERQFVVSSESCNQIAGLSLLSTPHLLREMEQTAIELIQDFLEESELTLPVEFSLEHRSPGMEGDCITCTAKVVHCEGPLVTFQWNAEANGKCLAQGLHKRRVLSRKNLLSRLQSRQLTAVENR